MKYWLKKPGHKDFIGPLSMDEINVEISRGFLDGDCEMLEAVGQSLGTLKKTTGWTAIGSIKPVTAATEMVMSAEINQHRKDESKGDEAPNSYLEKVRGKTCYAALRDMIGVFTGAAVVLFLLLAVFAIATGSQKGDGTTIITGIAIGAIGCFFAIASKQASVLLIDIADVLIDQNRRR